MDHRIHNCTVSSQRLDSSRVDVDTVQHAASLLGAILHCGLGDPGAMAPANALVAAARVASRPLQQQLVKKRNQMQVLSQRPQLHGHSPTLYALG